VEIGGAPGVVVRTLAAAIVRAAQVPPAAPAARRTRILSCPATPVPAGGASGAM